MLCFCNALQCSQVATHTPGCVSGVVMGLKFVIKSSHALVVGGCQPEKHLLHTIHYADRFNRPACGGDAHRRGADKPTENGVRAPVRVG